MAGKDKSRQRLITIFRYLREETEKDVPIDIKALQKYLGELSSTRQIIYQDFHAMEVLGAGITHDKNRHYYYNNHEFDDGELSLLADIICSSSYPDVQSAEKLILHIKQMSSMKKFDELTKQTDLYLRNKTLNPECIQNIEKLHEAIRNHQSVWFHYARYNERCELYYGIKDGENYFTVYMKPYKTKTNRNAQIIRKSEPLSENIYTHSVHTISPYKLIWDNAQCYLIGGMIIADQLQLRVFRVDKIFYLNQCEETYLPLDTSNPFYHSRTQILDGEKFLHSIFDMFSSKDNALTQVELLVKTSLVGTVIDHFGTDISFHKYDDNHFSFTVDVQVSNMFFGWIARFTPDEMRILSPDFLQKKFKEHILSITEQYD